MTKTQTTNVAAARYANAGQTAIEAVIDGVPMSVPADPSNRHYHDIMDGGIRIQPYQEYGSLAEAVAARRAQTDAILSEKLAMGAEYQGRRFELDDASVLRLNAALTVAETMEISGTAWPGVKWTDADNQLFDVPDLSSLREFVVALGAAGAALYAVWQFHKKNLQDLTAIADVAAYDITAGW